MANENEAPEQPGQVRVSDFDRSIGYDVDVLGFSPEWISYTTSSKPGAP